MSSNAPKQGGRYNLDDYVTVSERIERFYEKHHDGRIITNLVEINHETGFVLMQAMVYRTSADPHPAATGHAYEVRGESYINKNSYIENCECVPLESEILTRRGFLLFWELNVGEDVLAYNPANDRCEWTPLLRITTYPDAPVVRIRNKHGFDYKCTPDHSWAVLSQKWQRTERTLRKANEFQVSDRVIVAAPAEGGASPITPTEAAIIGWIFTDGHLRWMSDKWVLAYISQAKPAHIDELRALVGEFAREDVIAPRTRTFPTGRTYDTRTGYRWNLRGGFVRQLFEKAKIREAEDLSELVLRLSQESRAAMLRAMLQAEGDEVGRFGQKPGHVFEAFQLLATLEGYALGKLARDSGDVINVQKLRTRRYVCASQFSTEEAERQPVWCPTTTFGTWVMRQRGQVTITGNTGAVGRALALLGFEVRRGLSSREEMEKSPRITPGEAAAGERSKPAPAPPARSSDAAATKSAVKADKTASEEQKEEILNLLQRERPGDRRAQQKLLMEMTGKSSREELTEPDAVRLIGQLKKGKPSLAPDSKP